MKKRRPPVDKICAYCKQIFAAHESKIERGEDKFCSNPCRKAGRGYVEQVFNLLPSTVPQLIEITGLPSSTVRSILEKLVSLDRCHLSKLVRLFERGGQSFSPYFIQFKAGPKPTPSTLPQRIRGAQEQLTPHAVLAAMPGNTIELEERTGLSRTSVRRAVKILHDSKRCYISGWKRIGKTGGFPTYEAGARADEPNKIVPFTPGERVARFMKKAKQEGRLPDIKARRADLAALRRRVSSGDEFINALFGRPEDRNKETA